jgi:hypothetical protein
MVCQSYNLSNPHIEDYTLLRYDTMLVGYVLSSFWRSFRYSEDGGIKLLQNVGNKLTVSTASYSGGV